MRKAGLIVFFSFLLINVNCQSSFEITINRPLRDYSHSSIEAGNFYYTMGFIHDSIEYANGAIIKFDNENNLLIKEIIKNDTQTIINYAIEKTNNNILVVGWMKDTFQMSYLYVFEITTDLEIVMEKYHYFIPDGYDYFSLFDMVINQDDHIVLAGNFDDYAGTTGNCFLIVELDMDGNLLNNNYEESIYYDGTPFADLVVKQDGTGYYYFGGGSYEWVEFNNDLEYVAGGYHINWPHDLGGTISAKYLSNGNLMFVGMKSNSTYFYDLQLLIYNSELQNIKDTVIVEDGRQYPARLKGMDFITEDNIWVAVHDSWISPYGTEIYKIYIFDSDWNVKGSKYYGGDTQYDFNYVTATYDGGCIITGTCNQEEGSLDQDIFIKKVMPDDILTGTDEKVFTEFKDVLVYPNPVSDKIFLKADRKGLCFNLYNANGRIVYQSDIDVHRRNEINIAWLPAGLYIYSITNANGKAIDGGKLLKR